jgi:hypothetical protein
VSSWFRYALAPVFPRPGEAHESTISLAPSMPAHIQAAASTLKEPNLTAPKPAMMSCDTCSAASLTRRPHSPAQMHRWATGAPRTGASDSGRGRITYAAESLTPPPLKTRFGRAMRRARPSPGQRPPASNRWARSSWTNARTRIACRPDMRTAGGDGPVERMSS